MVDIIEAADKCYGKEAMVLAKGVRVGLREKVTVKQGLGARFPGEDQRADTQALERLKG